MRVEDKVEECLGIVEECLVLNLVCERDPAVARSIVKYIFVLRAYMSTYYQYGAASCISLYSSIPPNQIES